MAVNDLVLIGFGEAYASIETAWSLRDAGFIPFQSGSCTGSTPPS